MFENAQSISVNATSPPTARMESASRRQDTHFPPTGKRYISSFGMRKITYTKKTRHYICGKRKFVPTASENNVELKHCHALDGLSTTEVQSQRGTVEFHSIAYRIVSDRVKPCEKPSRVSRRHTFLFGKPKRRSLRVN